MLDRIHRIVRMVRKGDYPNCQQMATELEFSSRTLHRDIDFIRDRLELPLEYDEKKHGYYFSEEVGDFPELSLQSSDLLALFVAEKVLSQYPGTGLDRRLRTIFDKIITAIEGEVSVTWKELDELLSFRVNGVGRQDMKLFETLSEAVRKHREVEIRYHKLSARRPEQRVIHPYHLTSYNGLWYVIAFDKKRQALRTFALSRIENIQRTTLRFQRDPEFNPVDYQKNSFGIFHTGEKAQTVRVRFLPPVSRIVRERQWHSSQRIKQLPGDAIELTLKVGNLTEVANWVLSWGDHAEALAPVALRRHVVRQVKAMRKVYGV